jgi:hypothetical protein
MIRGLFERTLSIAAPVVSVCSMVCSELEFFILFHAKALRSEAAKSLSLINFAPLRETFAFA